MTRPVVVATMLLAVGAGLAQGQERPLRAEVLGSPALGKPAPPVVLPYVYASGPGPVDQPFRLSAELGRVVVLLFGGGTDSTGQAEWAKAIGRAAPLTGRAVVVAGVVRGSPETVLSLAASLGGEFKFLADADGRVHRVYGVGRGTRVWSAFVVADDGRLIWSGRVDPGSDQGWSDVTRAIKRGNTALPKAPR